MDENGTAFISSMPMLTVNESSVPLTQVPEQKYVQELWIPTSSSTQVDGSRAYSVEQMEIVKTCELTFDSSMDVDVDMLEFSLHFLEPLYVYVYNLGMHSVKIMWKGAD